MNDKKNLSEGFMNFLRLRTLPVGVKLLQPPALYRIREAQPPEEYFINLRKLEEERKK